MNTDDIINEYATMLNILMGKLGGHVTVTREEINRVYFGVERVDTPDGGYTLTSLTPEMIEIGPE